MRGEFEEEREEITSLSPLLLLPFFLSTSTVKLGAR